MHEMLDEYCVLMLGKGNLGQYIARNTLTNEICSWFETDQEQSFAVLCVL